MHRMIVGGLALATALSACSSSGPQRMAAPPDRTTAQTAADLTGTWAQTKTVVGSGLSMKLQTQGASVSGTGQYAMEAGRAGTLTVSGTIQGADVSLDLAFDYGMTAHCDAALVASDTLRGGIKYGPAAGMQPTLLVTFVKR